MTTYGQLPRVGFHVNLLLRTDSFISDNLNKIAQQLLGTAIIIILDWLQYTRVHTFAPGPLRWDAAAIKVIQTARSKKHVAVADLSLVEATGYRKSKYFGARLRREMERKQNETERLILQHWCCTLFMSTFCMNERRSDVTQTRRNPPLHKITPISLTFASGTHRGYDNESVKCRIFAFVFMRFDRESKMTFTFTTPVIWLRYKSVSDSCDKIMRTSQSSGQALSNWSSEPDGSVHTLFSISSPPLNEEPVSS